jgi:hypothetical protein
MAKFSFDLNCYNVMVNANSGRQVTATLDDVEISDVLNLFDCVEVVDHFGVKDLLEYIGEDECIKHFGLKKDDE